MHIATLNRTKRGLIFVAALLAAMQACSREEQPELTLADAAAAGEQDRGGCLIRAELEKNAKSRGKTETLKLTARFVRAPAPYLQKQPVLTESIAILDSSGATLWSMKYDPGGARLFRLPCVSGAHAVRVSGAESTSAASGGALTATIEKNQL